MSLSSAPSADLFLFKGWDSISPDPRQKQKQNIAVQGQTSPLPTEFNDEFSSENGSSTSISVCRTASQLAQALQGSAGINIGLGGLPLVGAKASFMDELKTTVFSLSVLVHARKVVEKRGTVQPTLREDLPADILQDLSNFVRLYGDSYISAVRLGAELQAAYTLYAQSWEQAHAVEQALAVSGIIQGLSLGTDLERKLRTVAEESGVNMSFKARAFGLGDQVLNQDNLMEVASGFSGMDITNPAVLDISTSSYADVPQLIRLFAPVERNRQLFLGGLDGSEGLLRKYKRLQELQNQILWVKGTYVLYSISEDPSLQANLGKVKKDQEAISQRIREYLNSPSTPVSEPELTSFTIGSPKLNVSLHTGPRMGGDGGSDFQGGSDFFYPYQETAIRQRARLESVKLEIGERIYQLIPKYTFDSSDATPRQTDERTYGKRSGVHQREIELGPGVGITRIQALTGSRVDQLFLTDNAPDARPIGGGGTKGNQSFNWQLPANSVLLGFSGRSNVELDALEPVFATFQSLTWQPIDAGTDA